MSVVKNPLLLLLLISVLAGVFHQEAKAQSIELVAGNTLNGAMNGVLLGGATMALQNSEDFEPVRVGLGAGTLYGLGIGIYDASRTEPGQQFYKSGFFNDGTNSSILVLLDTIYGAAGGVLVASSVSLIISSPLTEALQYGSGAGAWAGFGFGLLDTFLFAEGPDFSQRSSLSVPKKVNGFITYTNSADNVQIGMFAPSFLQQKKLTEHIYAGRISPSLNIIELNIQL